MNISIDWHIYNEHKVFFDEMAMCMKLRGHRVGIITGEREKDPFTNADIKEQMIRSLGFTPDFIHMWAQNESIANGNLWIAKKMDEENVVLHFDDDAREIKRYTDRWVVKVLNSGDINKF